MGIYDRDYIRRETPASYRGGGGRGGLSAVRMWSITTWLILICVLVFVFDGLTPRVAGWWRPVLVSSDVPEAVHILGGEQYQEIANTAAEAQALRSGALLFQRPVVDVSTARQDVVGMVLYQWMPPLQRWLYFSTDTAFRRLEVWRFVGFQFLHVNLMHLLFNMIALYFFGPLVERHLGSKRYVAFYLLCGVFGALCYLVLNLGGFVVSLVAGHDVVVPGLLFNSTATPLLGASAGVFGVLMAGAYLEPRVMVLLFFVIPMRLTTLAYALVALAILSVLFGGHNAGGEAGHLGGALAGFYFIRHPHHLHGFFDFVGWADPTSHHYRGRQGKPRAARLLRPDADRAQVDRILDKINASGLHSLTEKEKRILREASEE